MIHLHVTRGRRWRPLVAAAVLLFTGCTAAPAGAPTPTRSLAASATPAPSPSAVPLLTVGIVVPFTESAINSEVGVAQQRAAQLYLAQHDGKLGGREVKLVYSDESVNGALDATKAQQLVEDEHAGLLLGLVNDEGAYAVRGYADQHKVLFIDTSASGNTLTRATPGCTPACISKYVFRSSFTNWQLSEPLGEWVAKTGNASVFAVCADDAFGSESESAFEAGLAAKGGKIAGHDAVASGADWPKVVASLKAQPVKTVYAAFERADAIGFVTAWADAKMNDAGYRLFGPGPLAGVDVLAAVKDKADGITTSLFWASTLENAPNHALVELYPKTYKDEDGKPEPADAAVVEMWDTMSALDEALKTAGGSSADVLIPALEHVHATGARGSFSFDPTTHNVIDDVYVRQVRTSATTTAKSLIQFFIFVFLPFLAETATVIRHRIAGCAS